MWRWHQMDWAHCRYNLNNMTVILFEVVKIHLVFNVGKVRLTGFLVFGDPNFCALQVESVTECGAECAERNCAGFSFHPLPPDVAMCNIIAAKNVSYQSLEGAEYYTKPWPWLGDTDFCRHTDRQIGLNTCSPSDRWTIMENMTEIKLTDRQWLIE